MCGRQWAKVTGVCMALLYHVSGCSAGVAAPQLALMTADLSGWDCSIHEYFDLTYPLNFQVIELSNFCKDPGATLTSDTVQLRFEVLVIMQQKALRPCFRLHRHCTMAHDAGC